MAREGSRYFIAPDAPGVIAIEMTRGLMCSLSMRLHFAVANRPQEAGAEHVTAKRTIRELAENAEIIDHPLHLNMRPCLQLQVAATRVG